MNTTEQTLNGKLFSEELANEFGFKLHPFWTNNEIWREVESEFGDQCVILDDLEGKMHLAYREGQNIFCYMMPYSEFEKEKYALV